MSHNWNLCLHTALQTNLNCNLKTLHALMWEEEDLLGMLHLIVSNFSKKKNVSAVPVITCVLWYSNIWYWQDLCGSLGSDLSWWDWLTSDRAARGQETWSRRSVGSGGQGGWEGQGGWCQARWSPQLSLTFISVPFPLISTTCCESPLISKGMSSR